MKITVAEIQEVVADNEKQRFKLIPVSEAPNAESGAEEPISFESGDKDDPSQWLIRANQGHSIKVDEEGLMEPVTLDSELPSTVVHGTDTRAWPLILSSGGLKKMGRNHIHFALGLPGGFKTLTESSSAADEVQKEPVISGMRKSSSVLIFIDIRQALEDGVKFWRSANGVVLSEGNDSGLLPVRYFKRVEVRKAGKGVVMENGVLMSQMT